MTGARRQRSFSIWIAASARPMASRRDRRRTATSAAPVIIPCSCSTSLVTLNGVPCVLATSTAPAAGATFWNPSSSGIGNGTCAAISGGMPPSPHQTSMSFWKPRASCMRSACQRIRFFRRASAICSHDPLAVRRTMCGAITPASATRLEAGTRSGAWWPRWNGILGNWFPVSASSSPI
uniref:Uncharacterized protein n=1 Tax=uncultured marine microorganism HF4000_APKG8L7 TaxID=455556 RepID=B3TB86_9ZZZZ|nr:hypothetical protein ALOHA_HF4000APKG8L7ctg1g20 [uncultured marine microorganism HF4000_APKG8L7]